MDNETALGIRQLVANRLTASLGTLHSGAPYVSMVPYAVMADGSAFVIHVSRLAAHTNDMVAEPRVSLLITAPEQSDVSPQALPRLTVIGVAQRLAADTPAGLKARQLYLSRFPDAAPMFELGDFSLFGITPTTLRWVGGFGRATSLTCDAFAKLVSTD